MNVRVIFIPLSMAESIDSNKEVFKDIPSPGIIIGGGDYNCMFTNPEFTRFNCLRVVMDYSLLKSLPKISTIFLGYINTKLLNTIMPNKDRSIIVILEDKCLEDIPAKDYDDGDMSLKDYIGLMNGWELLKSNISDTVENEPKVIVGQTIHRNQGFKQSELIKDNVYYRDCEFIINQKTFNNDSYAYLSDVPESKETYLSGCIFKFSTLEVKPSNDNRLTIFKALENTYCGNTDANMKRYNDNGWTYIDGLSRGNQLLLVAEVVLGREVCYAVGPERVENSAYLTRINDMEVKDKTWK